MSYPIPAVDADNVKEYDEDVKIDHDEYDSRQDDTNPFLENDEFINHILTTN